MPSSISSSDHGFAERVAPVQPWLAMLVAAIVVIVTGSIWWETEVREMGYGPTLDDTPNLWAERRAMASHIGPEQLVFVGASRTLFDIDLEVFRDATNGPLPIQLATVGSNPMVILTDLAKDPTCAGTIIVGVVPGLLAAGGGPPIATPTRYVEHYAKWSVADRLELPMSLWLQDRLAFLNMSDLSLAALLDRGLALPPREDAFAPRIPGYMYSLDRTRRARMTERVATDPEAMHEIQQIWIPLFSPPPKPSMFTDEEWAKMMDDGLSANMTQMAANVEAITARGGRVIFVRFPSTGTVRELENRFTPRPMVWDRLLRETGAPGVHFEDHPELQGFDCPEWSHLNAEDSVEFSRRLVRVMKARNLI